MPIQIDLTPQPFITVQFADGITATSSAISINTTYDEDQWLGGAPDKRWNTRYLDNVRRTYAKQFANTTPYIVPCEAETIETDRPPERAIEILPRIRIAGIFTTYEDDEFGEENALNLYIIWHQNEITTLMLPEIKAHLTTLNWATLSAPPSVK
jgi:hypothetical protein